ncbi:MULTISPECIES: Lrp/AsnC family transcriptional regulator [unclassified Lentilitoribacter]|jgi:Lrp/AsnC family transcriptional regulator|uniref:Lrp/AsnC family transcriptional regulator n=1 Tax=unclassified Lentilitoribacter TaxID=2647570 RepID=UPI001FCE8DE9|nr:Lrp/AsnC family transcriptional regulator [Lentilitoribacter sp. Alg239-R112]
MAQMSVDATDRKILKALQKNPDMTMRELGEETGLSHTPCWRRLSKMKQSGVVDEKRYIVDPTKVGLDIVIFCFVRLREHNRDSLNAFETAVADVPEVMQCYTMTGDHDYILRVLAQSVTHYESTIKNSLMQLPNVAFTHTSLALKEVKNTASVPL